MKNLLIVAAMLLAGSAKAGLYYDNTVTSTSDTMKIAGVLLVNDKAAPGVQKIRIDGTGGAITATTFTGALSGNATTASALAANGANCSTGAYPLGVDASGAAEGCTTAGVGDMVLSASNSGAGSLALTATTSKIGINDSTPDAGFDMVSAAAPTGYVLSVSSQNDTTGNIFSIKGNGSAAFMVSTFTINSNGSWDAPSQPITLIEDPIKTSYAGQELIKIFFQTARVNNNGMWVSSSSGAVSLPYTGTYKVTCEASFSSMGAASTQLRVYPETSVWTGNYCPMYALGGAPAGGTCTRIFAATAGDTADCKVYVDTTNTASTLSSAFIIVEKIQ